MADHIAIYERVGFDANGQAVSWERSYDRKTWELVSHPFDRPPFVLIKPIPLPGFVETEIWEKSNGD